VDEVVGKTAFIIVAAGSGTRFGGAKQFLLLEGLPLYVYSVLAFAKFSESGPIVIVAQPEDHARILSEVAQHDVKSELHIVTGGSTRQASVRAGLEFALTIEDIQFALVHDAARPLVSNDVIARTLTAVQISGSAIAAIPVVDSLKLATEERKLESGERVDHSISRVGLWRAQTPQGAGLEELLRAVREADAAEHIGTDESELLERIGIHPQLILSNEDNFKITYESDLERAALILRAQK
jgi:2-C-methyl-D-erythritol 4-phosphate cytidylyltransferase